MAITNLNTVVPNAEGGKGGTLKTVLIIATVIGVGYLAYKHWYKPRFVDKVQDNVQNNVQG
jgi:hypothetical protein